MIGAYNRCTRPGEEQAKPNASLDSDLLTFQVKEKGKSCSSSSDRNYIRRRANVGARDAKGADEGKVRRLGMREMKASVRLDIKAKVEMRAGDHVGIDQRKMLGGVCKVKV
jgi:hypothetical protein